MNDELFDWDDANILHLAEHDVRPEESEEVVLGDPLDLGSEFVDGEVRWSYVGETNNRRILQVAITLRGERVRVVTAFEAPRYWKMFYLEQKAAPQ